MKNMADVPFRELIVKCGVSELFFDGECDGSRAICWTRLAADGGSWILAVSDGSEVWRAIFEKQDVDTQCEISGLGNCDEYLEIIKDSFEDNTVCLVKVGGKIVLQCPGRRKTTVNFDLYESKVADRKTELRYILFRLTDKMGELRKGLTDANEVLEAERRREKNEASGLDKQSFGFEPVRKAGQAASNVRRKQGHSLVNPNSKKAKKAKGISFE